MFTRTPFYITIIGLLLLCNCQVDINPTGDDEEMTPPPPVTIYEDGFFISNRGNPADGTSGTISFYHQPTDQMVNDIYQKANGDKVVGSNLQHIAVQNNIAYLLVEEGEKVIVANARNFENLGDVGGLQRPRFILPLGDKAYISQWGSDGYTGSIQIMDLTDNEIVRSIPVRGGPGRMIRKGDFVYVAHSGGFGLDSVITKIDVERDRVVKTIDVGLAPNSLAIDRNNHLWVLCQGVKDQNNPARTIPGQLVRLEGDAVKFELEVPSAANNLVINQSGDQLFFTMNEWIQKHNISDTELDLAPFIAQSFSHLFIEPLTGNLVGANAQNLVSRGSISIFDVNNGEELSMFEVGVFPNGFWAN